MEIVLLVIIIILIVILLFKDKKDMYTIDKINKLELNFIKEINNFKGSITKSFNEDFISLSERIDIRLRVINDKVNAKLDENFTKSYETFSSVLQRLTKIDEAQKNIDELSKDIVSLQNVLTDKKTRGIFGEVNLGMIMSNIFGDNNEKIYRMQYKFPNNNIADCVLFGMDPLGTIAIDSKFPLENYMSMVDKNLNQYDRDIALKKFKLDLKKHIDDISSKYIIPNVTNDYAVMFLPAEAIFAEINAYHQDIIEYSFKKKVWITSPTTLISLLSIIQMIIKNRKRDEYSKIIHHELNLLSTEFDRYKQRWDKLSKSINSVSREVDDIHITTDKIAKRFESISSVNIDKKIEENDE